METELGATLSLIPPPTANTTNKHIKELIHAMIRYSGVDCKDFFTPIHSLFIPFHPPKIAGEMELYERRGKKCIVENW